ncbi:MAG: GYD domain-containing protein [Actinobacteria bacterium]|nr:GYD domain-containing protein [Actinomycetota bacterium]
MPKYLFEAHYTPEGVRGLKEAGASSRAKAVNEMATGLGGRLESFHFAFGDVDAYVVVDLPDDEAAAAAAFTVAASPLTKVKTIKLLTVDEADAAIGRSVSYQPPGG